MGFLHYKTEFTSDGGQDYKIEIRSKSDSSGTDIDYTSGKDGFKLKYKEGKYLRLAMCMPSSVKFAFNVTDDTSRDFIHDILSTSTGDWYIRIYQGTALYWAGWITPEYDTYNNMPYPYFVNVKANDSIGRLVDKYNNSVETDNPNDFKGLTYPLTFFDDLYDLDTLIGASAYKWNFLYDWWNENTSYVSTDNPLRSTYYNRNAFVKDNENFPLIIGNYLTELNGVLKTIGGRLFFCCGEYWLQQDGGLDTDTIDYFSAITPSDVGTELQLTGVNNAVEIDNTAAISGTNAHILAGATYTQDPELNSIRAKYIHGNAGVLFDTTNDYTSLDTIGVLGSGVNLYTLRINLTFREFFTSSAVTPNSLQSQRMACKWVLTLKVGTYYYTDSDGWTTTPGTFKVFSGMGTGQPNGSPWTGEADFTSYEEGYNGTTEDRASFRAYTEVILPITPTYGEVQFKIEPEGFYFVEAANSTLSIYSLLDAIASTGNSSLNGATRTSTEQLLVNTPLPTSLFPTSSASADTNIGSEYIAAQDPATQNADLNLGDLALGTPPIDTNLTTLAYLDGSDYKNAEGFRRGNSGSYIASSLLLCREYLQATDKPVIILQATIINPHYTPRMTLKYASEIGGSLDRFIFTRGEFIAARDEWRGEWYRSEETGSPSYTETTVTIYTPPPPDPHNPHDGPEPTAPPPPPKFPAPPAARMALNGLLSANTIGVLSTALSAGGVESKIIVSDLKSDLASGQNVTVCDSKGFNPIDLATSQAAEAGDTSIDFANWTCPQDYPVGSLLLIKANDIQNQLPAAVEPGGADKQIQFNDGGAFGGDSGLTFTKASGYVGIGTDDPQTKLEISDASEAGLTIRSVSETGYSLINFADAADDNVGRIYYDHDDEYMSFRVNDAERIHINSNGNVGIGLTPSYQLQLSTDSAAKLSTATWDTTSDERVKTNIEPYVKGLDEIVKLEPKTFDYNGKAGFDSSIKGNIGIIAQEIKDIFPETIKIYKAKLNEEDDQETELLSFNPHAITFALINAVKELSQEVKGLKERIENLEKT